MLNLTVKIEVFKGNTGNAKNDDDSWTLLTGEDLDFIEGEATGSTLLCRMSLYDENLDRDIRLPILNKYFLIGTWAVDASAATVTAATVPAGDASVPATIIYP